MEFYKNLIFNYLVLAFCFYIFIKFKINNFIIFKNYNLLNIKLY